MNTPPPPQCTAAESPKRGGGGLSGPKRPRCRRRRRKLLLRLHGVVVERSGSGPRAGGGGGRHLVTAPPGGWGCRAPRTHNRSNTHPPHGRADTDGPTPSAERRTGDCAGPMRRPTKDDRSHFGGGGRPWTVRGDGGGFRPLTSPLSLLWPRALLLPVAVPTVSPTPPHRTVTEGGGWP